MAASAAPLEPGWHWPSGALPVGEVMKPPGRDHAIKGAASTMRSRITGRPARGTALMTMTWPSRKWRMCSGSRGPGCGAVGMPLITTPHDRRFPSRQSWSKVIGACQRRQAFVDHVGISGRHVGADVLASILCHVAVRTRVLLSPDHQHEIHGHL